MAALLGMLTGIGGVVMRDVSLTEIPQVLRSDLYAVAALAGASTVVVGDLLGLSYGIHPPDGRDLVLRHSIHGDQTWLAFAHRSSFRTKTRGGRPFERREIALKFVVHRRGAVGRKPANRRNTETTRDPCFYSRRHWHHCSEL